MSYIKSPNCWHVVESTGMFRGRMMVTSVCGARFMKGVTEQEEDPGAPETCPACLANYKVQTNAPAG